MYYTLWQCTHYDSQISPSFLVTSDLIMIHHRIHWHELDNKLCAVIKTHCMIAQVMNTDPASPVWYSCVLVFSQAGARSPASRRSLLRLQWESTSPGSCVEDIPVRQLSTSSRQRTTELPFQSKRVWHAAVTGSVVCSMPTSLKHWTQDQTCFWILFLEGIVGVTLGWNAFVFSHVFLQ